jgi:hypothetical protein
VVAGGPGGEEQPGGAVAVEVQEAVPGGEEAEDVDDRVDEVAEAELECCGFLGGAGIPL